MMTKPNTFERIRKLSVWQQKLLTVALLQRMLPNWCLFCQVTEFTDEKKFINGLDSLWRLVEDRKQKVNLSALLERIEEFVPEAKDFDMFGVYPAIDTAMAFSAAIGFFQTEHVQELIAISKLSQASVERVIQLSEDSIEDGDFWSHPMMQQEILVQNTLLDILNENGDQSAIISEVKALLQEEGCSNIGVVLSEQS